MESRNTNTEFKTQGRIDTKIHDSEALSNAVDDWNQLSKREKLEVARATEPEVTHTSQNVTTDRFHEYFVDNLDPDQTDSKSNLTASWVALGNNSVGGTSTSDTDLNNRVFEERVTDHADSGKELLASTFVDSTEANGNTLNEIGLFTGDPNNLSDNEVFMINHATFSDVTKDNSKTVTFDVTLTFSDS